MGIGLYFDRVKIDKQVLSFDGIFCENVCFSGTRKRQKCKNEWVWCLFYVIGCLSWWLYRGGVPISESLKLKYLLAMPDFDGI